MQQQGSYELGIWLKIKQEVTEPLELSTSVWFRDIYVCYLMKFSC